MSPHYHDQNQAFHDPNKNKEKRFPYDEGKRHMKENIVDANTDMIYQEKHWKSLNELRPDLVDSFHKGSSPLSRMIEAGVCEGALHIKGNFFNEHKDEIMGAIKHSDQIAQERDEMNRVINIVRINESDIGVFTSKNQLAVTIGKKLDSAFKGGKLDIHWGKGDKEVDVVWHKDLDQ